MKISVIEALSALQSHEGKTFLQLFQHGTMSVEIYQPQGRDGQQPHQQDEVYIVISGSGLFQNGLEKHPFGPGDFLFVPAGMEHRFLDFTEDFKTWVIFYGAKGGEGSTAPVVN
jgi:mannose-6-phosphate isomerase-like protein (cupin superfamily)